MAYHHFPWHDAFLAALRQRPVVQFACDAVGIERSTAYRRRDADKDFAKAWDDALEAGIDAAEAEAFRRGLHGYEEPVIDKGRLAYRYERYEEQVEMDDGSTVTRERFRPVLDANGQPVPLTVRKHSDALLALVLKARRAAYRVERTEVTSPDGSMSPTDEASRHARVAALMARAKSRRDAAAADEPPQDFSDLA